MAVCELGIAFGVVADEIERRTCTAGSGVDAVGAVLKKLAQKRLAVVADAGGFRASDAGLWQDGANGGSGQIVEAVVLGGCAVPVADVRLVPHLPEPGCGLIAVALAQV